MAGYWYSPIPTQPLTPKEAARLGIRAQQWAPGPKRRNWCVPREDVERSGLDDLAAENHWRLHGIGCAGRESCRDNGCPLAKLALTCGLQLAPGPWENVAGDSAVAPHVPVRWRAVHKACSGWGDTAAACSVGYDEDGCGVRVVVVLQTTIAWLFRRTRYVMATVRDDGTVAEVARLAGPLLYHATTAAVAPFLRWMLPGDTRLDDLLIGPAGTVLQYSERRAAYRVVAVPRCRMMWLRVVIVRCLV